VRAEVLPASEIQNLKFVCCGVTVFAVTMQPHGAGLSRVGASFKSPTAVILITPTIPGIFQNWGK
jgi:hypothetical protein